jgi:hypothetical protein
MPNLFDDETDDETIDDLPSEDVSPADTRYAAVLAALDAVVENPDDAEFKSKLESILNPTAEPYEPDASAISQLAVKAARSPDIQWFMEELQAANARVAAQFGEPEPEEDVIERTWVDDLDQSGFDALQAHALNRAYKAPMPPGEWSKVLRQAGLA